MRALRRRFETLRWRLILACFVAAFTAMMTLVLVFVLVPAIVTMTGPQRPASLVQGLRKLAPRIAPYLRQSPPNRSQIMTALTTDSQPILVTASVASNLHSDSAVIPGRNSALLVVGRDGQVLATLAPTEPANNPLGRLLQLSGTKAAIAAALRNDTQSADLVQNLAGEPTVAAAPIVDTDGTVRGALLLDVDLATLLRPLYFSNLLALVPTVVLFVIVASMFGALFGLLTARGLTRRLLRLTSAADAWSQGDFAVTARDPSSDELGQLARDLNRMAEQLRNLLRDQQQLAVIEERNRLARELHDSVKQQMFALTMLIGSAQLEVDDQSEAKRILSDAERIVGNAQQEMSALIQALRPVALANKDLAVALREFCHDWEQRNGITCAVTVPDTLTIAPEVEQQVFRVAQEALANIAKHSGATRVEVYATDEQGTLALRIRDNGSGFDVARTHGRGLGLSSMRERVAELGGTLTIASATGGTCIEARAPLDQLAPPARHTASATSGREEGQD
ncbi:MAG TPA: histidine kinase [Ktedonobacterales bacterium]|nr:histidine kinase [Ktedonobacterales bacterium]